MIIDLSVDPDDHEPGCKRSGWIEDANGMPVGRCRACDQRGQRIAVPPRFRKRVEVPSEIEEWLTTNASFYLCGPVGTGKTQYAWAATVAWSQHRRERVRPVQRATALFDELRPGNDQVRAIIDDCQRAPLLALDDLGAEKASEWTRERVYEIVDERYAWQRPVLITSNLTPMQLAEHVGERVASRLSEMCTVLPVLGRDRRRPQPAP